MTDTNVAADIFAFPVSFAQQRLWFLDQLQPGNPAYNIAAAVRLTGRLDVPALERSLNEIVRRHEALRTTFAVVDEAPVQLIHPEVGLPLPLVELSGETAEEREADFRRLSDEEAARPFDLQRGPLLRTTLLKSAEEEHYLLVTMHHIVSDGWSVWVFAKELTAHYEAYTSGRDSALEELPIQYADFSHWQREWLSGEPLERQLSYWREQLADAPAVLQLPTDRARPVAQTFRGERRTLLLNEGLTDALKALARGEGATPYMTLLAAFQLHLGRLSGQDDISVGTPVAGRTRAETEGLIGFFVNTLVMRARLAGDPSFRELLGRARQSSLEAYAHQDVPFEKLLEELQPERSLSHSPLFQVFFNMLNFPERSIMLPGLAAEVIVPQQAEAKFDLTLYVEEQAGRFRLDLVYNADLFEQDRASEMLEQYAYLLEQIAADPDAKTGSLSLVTPRAARLLPDPAEAFEPEWRGPVTAQFAERAARHPERRAAADALDSWTYGELHERSNQLAHYLIACGVEPGDTVAVYAHRSASLVWALLGTLKAGAAFVSLDPAYPPARLKDYMEMARPRAFIHVEAAGRLSDALEEFVSTLSLCCRVRLPGRATAAACGLLADYPTTVPSVWTGPDDLAYVAFTSGSTGRPKGIMGRHGSLAHFAPWAARTFGLNESEHFSVLSGLSHDPLHRDIFTPLQLGACALLPDEQSFAEPGRLAEWMERQRVTVANLTPAMGQLVSETAPGEDPPRLISSLRHAFYVGDVLTKRDVARLRRRAPLATCVNLYGATETQRAVSYHVINDAGETFAAATSAAAEKEVIQLGRGIKDVQLLVLNAARQPAGVGELGEIYFRSPHLALGYLGDEAMTAERFVANPFTGEATDRLYRTGDLGRYLPDGGVAPSGRADQQVKIRGFRIELGEIEAALGQHPSVKEAAVIAREDAPGGKRLVAYHTAHEGTPAATGAELRTHLKTRLPEYMIPSAWVALERLPLTPNGKLDRKALPAPEHTGQDNAETFVAPRTPVEEVLAGIWSEVLGAERVGAEDNFFDLGGHSLLVTQVASRVRSAFNVELSLRSVFEAPTVSELAARVEAATREGAAAHTPLVRVERGGPLPLSFAQQRLWFLDQLEPESAAYNIPAAVRLRGALDLEALAGSLSYVAGRHESLRTTFSTEAGEPVQVIHERTEVSLPVVDLTHLPEAEREEEARRLSLEESRKPFDLARGPLVRASLSKLSEQEHVLTLVMHHVISDGWSMGVLVRDMVEAYGAFGEGREPSSPELPVQYADYAAWQRARMTGETLDAQLGYWREQLAGAPPVLELPTDRPRPAVQSMEGASHRFRFDRELTEELQRLSRREGATLFMTLLAAFQTLLHRYTGQDDISVGTPVAGRTQAETERLIGFFVNTLVMRARLGGTVTFRELLSDVRRTALSAYANQDVPFDKLVEELQPERDLSRTPLFQVMFTLQNTPGAELKLPGLGLTQLPLEGTTSKFDLELIFTQTDEGLEGVIEYSTELFDATTVERLASHLRVLLAAAAAEPETRLSRLPLLTQDERRLLLSDWNDTRADYPSDKTFNNLFSAQALRAPDAPAVSGPGGSYSYAGLDRLASRVARALSSRGAGPEHVVALLCERTEATVAAVLGVLRSGAAYLPLDPRHPSARHRQVLERSGARLILAGPGLTEAAREAAGEGAEVLDLEVLLAGGDGDGAAPFVPTAPAGPRSLAYVIYTSGSTGAPKGAMVEHRGMLNHLLAKVRDLSLTESDAVAQTAPLCFDISVWQMLSPLASGGRVEVLPDTEAHDPSALLKAVEGRGVSVLELVPSMLRAVNERLEAEGAGAPGRLRWLLATGEALPPAVCRGWLRATGGRVPVVNAYGPTECSDDVTHEFIRQEEEAGGAQVPVGRALQNTRLYVVSANLEPAPVGVAGELLVGGDGVGRGYLGEAKLTAEKFIPDSFSGEAGSRLYRTGDLVKYLADGRVEFLGRLDEQVKVRGHRIELGEIESALLRHESVREALVVVREDAPGDRRLVAYLSGAGEAPPVVAELRSFLKETLPEYMVPAAFVVLDEMPLTANGKVDKKALPAPDASAAELTEGYVAPRNATEETLAGIWSQVLGVERVGAEDNFFELGGHSLLATQLMSRVLLEFGVQVGLRSFFEEPTVAGLALAVVQEQAAQTDEAEMAAILAELDGLAEGADGAQLFDNVGTAAD